MTTSDTRQPVSIVTAQALVQALVDAGVEYVVHCPGSRCAPFAYCLDAAERAGLLTVDVHIDERGAAFAALGAAASTGIPTAVITTSGTAVANLHPALLEAAHARIPLLAITADRPEHLVGAGANQTTFQTGIFGPLIPTVTVGSGSPLQPNHARLAIRRALGFGTAAAGVTACLYGSQPGVPTGPGHLNVHFDDPLFPRHGVTFTEKHQDSLIASGWNHSVAQQRVQPLQDTEPQPTPYPGLDWPLHSVVVAGDKAWRDIPDLAQLCASAHIPLLAEPASGVRCDSAAITNYRQHTALADVEHVFMVGRPTLSRPITRLLERAKLTAVVGVHGIVDPTLNATRVITAEQLRSILTPTPVPAVAGGCSEAAQWLDHWLNNQPDPAADMRSQAAQLIWDDHARSGANPLVLGASGTIRAFDLAARPGPGCGLVLSNRGLAGIDGTIATAYGVARATGRATRAVLGDVTFLHDVSSLALLQPDSNEQLPLQIIVMNDGGGNIFRQLEHAEAADKRMFDRYFLTRRDVNVAAVAVGYGWEYTPIQSLDELDYLVRRPIREPGIVEVFLSD